ncbi:MAG: hypothetical protein RLZZ127_432 [Planctomycetota bacterium]|jgi:hypothetical protein
MAIMRVLLNLTAFILGIAIGWFAHAASATAPAATVAPAEPAPGADTEIRPATAAALRPARRSLTEGTLPFSGGRRTAEGWIADGRMAIVSDERIAAPCRITITAKTSRHNLRIGWLMDQLIFNWEADPGQLRMDGGPFSGMHVPGAGYLQPDRWATIVIEAQPDGMTVTVDGRRRFSGSASLTGLDGEIGFFTSRDSILTVRDVVVEPVPATLAPGDPVPVAPDRHGPPPSGPAF